MNPNLKAKLENLPDNPGVYQFLNDKGKVIYVGKAINLKNRVRSYFHSSVNSAKTLALINKISDYQLILTDNEIEALVLENNLIKELKPRYNVNLKDDKSYPFIKVTNEPYPRIYHTRRVIKDGSKYFGPYTDVKNMKSSLRMINQIFKIRSCRLDITQINIEKKRFKVCLDYHIKKCDGPCEGLISQKDYNEMVSEVVKLLKGKIDDLITDLNFKMKNAVAELNFERAADLRDKIAHLQSISSKQKIVSDDIFDRDVIAIAFEKKDCACSVFNIRGGKLVSKKQLRMVSEEGADLSDLYSAAIRFYYTEFTEIPDEIILEIKPVDAILVNDWLNLMGNKKIRFIIPQKGSTFSLMKMCTENARLQLKEIQLQKMKKEGYLPHSIASLQRDLRLNILPRKIECFDISNLQGTDSVASLVVFYDGKPKKSLYRKFIIKDVEGPDDFSSMQEVIRRRYSRLINDKENLPDLIMVDGGKGQLSSAVKILEDLGIHKYNVIGLAKRLEEVFLPRQSEPVSIPKTSSGIKLLQQIRDEAHRFAVTFHRKRRSKRTITSELTEIKGIGKLTAQKLLGIFGSVNEIRKSSTTSLSEVIGIQKAKIIKDHFSE